MNIDDLRITKMKNYLVDIIKEISSLKNMNTSILSKETDSYSIDRMPITNNISKYITNGGEYREVYLLKSRNNYSYKDINNLENIGFYEILEEKIEENNYNEIYPDIENIYDIRCLDAGTLRMADTNTAEFGIQIQITYDK